MALQARAAAVAVVAMLALSGCSVVVGDGRLGRPVSQAKRRRHR